MVFRGASPLSRRALGEFYIFYLLEGVADELDGLGAVYLHGKLAVEHLLSGGYVEAAYVYAQFLGDGGRDLLEDAMAVDAVD